MPYEWRFEGDLIRSAAFGVFTATEALRFLAEAAVAERARGITAHRLTDLRRVTAFVMDYLALRELARIRVAAAAAQTKTAMLTENDLQFGMVRMFQTLLAGSPISVEIFSSEDAALAWLATPQAPAR
jgi:hypothetical protein